MIRAVLSALGAALILVPFSEILFYPVSPETIYVPVGFYAVLAMVCVIMVEDHGPPSLARVVIGGAALGWIVEAIFVWVVYEAVPFSILWPSVGWHMVVSVLAGIWGLGWALRRSVWAVLGISLGLGAFLGLWGGYAWPVFGPETTPDGTPSYWSAMVIGTLMVALGHLILALRPAARAPEWVFWAVFGLALLNWAVSWAGPFFPVSIIGPLLMALCLWLLRRPWTGERALDNAARWDGFAMGLGEIARRVPGLVAMPLVAVPVQGWAESLDWSESGSGDFTLLLTVVGGGLLLWAIVAILRGRA